MTCLANTRPVCHGLKNRRLSVFDIVALYRQRRALAVMTDEILTDLGLTRSEANAESRRPLWDIPAQML